jgi:hypothetical protein
VDNPGDGAGIDGVMAGVVPEPATMTLFGLGLAGLAARTIRRKRG